MYPTLQERVLAVRVLAVHAKTCSFCEYDGGSGIHVVVTRCAEGDRLLALAERSGHATRAPAILGTTGQGRRSSGDDWRDPGNLARLPSDEARAVALRVEDALDAFHAARILEREDHEHHPERSAADVGAAALALACELQYLALALGSVSR